MNVNDKVSLEYEARVMVEKDEYQKIKEDYLKIGRICRELVNINTYFDTEDLYLSNQHVVLRVREINNIEKELTLKIKGNNGDTEINHVLGVDFDEQNIIDVIKENTNIFIKLNNIGLDIDKIKPIAILKTERLEIEFEKFLLVIDKNYYNNKVDYNIEVESTSISEAEKYLKEVIKPYNIEYKKDYRGKASRAIFKL